MGIVCIEYVDNRIAVISQPFIGFASSKEEKKSQENEYIYATQILDRFGSYRTVRHQDIVLLVYLVAKYTNCF